MNVKELQQVIGTPADGRFGPVSKAALLAQFTNSAAPAVSVEEMEAIAKALGVTLRQLAAVATVESSGGGFDKTGRPKIRYERHWFHRLTKARFGISDISMPGTDWSRFDSWDRLAMACALDPDAAFASCSWGKFQVMGGYWQDFGYSSPYALAHSTVTSEAGHYELLVRYIQKNGLQAAMRKLSNKADDCREFARRYNGPGYEEGGYHTKLARAMS